jgi:hypothetical protein
VPELIFERRSHYSDPSGAAPGTGLKPLFDLGKRSFTVTNISMGGDPCPSQTKQLNISVNFYETHELKYHDWQIPDDTTTDLSPVCCGPHPQ